ncbi:MAG: biotin-dependent carboxylase-like uncharacterized protein [Alteromonadaceae bacterium]|jgi:biotin-dependent carboxylase-like uncharacterized protein
MNFLSVLKLKGQCSIQDLGRLHAQHLGFSASGAADEYAFLSANQMLGNQLNSAALEVIFGQITLRTQTHCTIAITGANCVATINEKAISHWQVHQLQAGDTLSLSMPKRGLITYIAVAGGIKSKLWLDSRSQTLNEQVLGFNEEKITLDSKITCNEKYQPITPTKNIKQQSPDNFYKHNVLTLRFIPQKLWLDLDNAQQQKVLEQQYTISSKSNRMGYRLSQLPPSTLAHIANRKTLSKPVTYGTIQLPESGEPIILMKERQTIGGYPVLGNVIQTDLFRLSQLKSGEKVILQPTTLIHAQQQLNALYQRFI